MGGVRLDQKRPVDSRKLWTIAGIAIIGICVLNWKNVPDAYVTGLVSALKPIITGIVFALVLNAPLRLFRSALDRLDRKGLLSEGARDGIAIALVLVLVVVFLYAALVILVPQVIKMLERLVNYLINSEGLQVQIRNLFNIPPETWQTTVQNWVNQLTAAAAGYLQQGVSGLISVTTGMLNLVLSLTIGFYMIGCRRTLKRQFNRAAAALLPASTAKLAGRTIELAGSTMSRWFGHQMLEGLIFSTALAAVMLILRLPYIVPVVFVTFCLYMIPYIGSWTSFALGFLLMLSVDLHTAIVFGVMLIILQTLDGNILNPHLVGGSVGLPPWLSLSAVCFFGAAFGFQGMLLGVPVCAVLYALFKEFVSRKEMEKARSPEGDGVPPAGAGLGGDDHKEG